VPLKIALDTSFIIALLDEKDIWRAQALTLQTALEAFETKPVVFDCVLAEALSTLSRRLHEKRRSADLPPLISQFKKQFPKNSILWLYPDLPTLYDEVIALVEQSAGMLNFNDALIALACRDRKIRLLASFDSDFDQVAWLKRIALAADLTIP
jgi:predicted nucleic acid-binding protein